MSLCGRSTWSARGNIVPNYLRTCGGMRMSKHTTNPYFVGASLTHPSKHTMLDWKDLLERKKHTHNGLQAIMQKDGFYRCHYLENCHVYTCICKDRPTAPFVDCQVQPRDGLQFLDYDSLPHMKVRRKCLTVLWDTTYAPLTDEDELRKISLRREKTLAQNQINDRYLIRRKKLAEEALQLCFSESQ